MLWEQSKFALGLEESEMLTNMAGFGKNEGEAYLPWAGKKVGWGQKGVTPSVETLATDSAVKSRMLGGCIWLYCAGGTGLQKSSSIQLEGFGISLRMH